MTEEDQQIAASELEATDYEASKRNFLKPKYKEDTRLKMLIEYDSPSPLIFEAVGWDRDRTQPGKEKHYRRWVNKPLEDD